MTMTQLRDVNIGWCNPTNQTQEASVYIYKNGLKHRARVVKVTLNYSNTLTTEGILKPLL